VRSLSRESSLSSCQRGTLPNRAIIGAAIVATIAESSLMTMKRRGRQPCDSILDATLDRRRSRSRAAGIPL
jgi:hypothetical protein